MKVGFALTGSFCTFDKVIPQIAALIAEGFDVIPLMSEFSYATDTRFGRAEDFRNQILHLSGHEILHTIQETEPFGPKGPIDLLIIAPCTGNTLGKLANGINDTCVTMAAKAQLRNGRPVVLAVSTNDGLGASARNIGTLQCARNVYFVPYRQDDCVKKPASLVADFDQITETVREALAGRQIQPVLCRN